MCVFLCACFFSSFFFQQELVDENSRVHCSLNLNTETGRLSARKPNLQNQPALEKDQYKIRVRRWKYNRWVSVRGTKTSRWVFEEKICYLGDSYFYDAPRPLVSCTLYTYTSFSVGGRSSYEVNPRSPNEESLGFGEHITVGVFGARKVSFGVLMSE